MTEWQMCCRYIFDPALVFIFLYISLNQMVSIAAINNPHTRCKTYLFLSAYLLWWYNTFQENFPVMPPFESVWRNRGHTARPLGCCADALLDSRATAKAKPCVVSSLLDPYTFLILNYCCTGHHRHAIIPAWKNTDNKAKGILFSERS